MTDPTPAIGAPHPRRRLRNYLLAPRFQLKYTGALVGTAFLLLASLGVVIKEAADLAVEQAREAAEVATVAEGQAERAFRESQASARLMRMNQIDRASDNPELVRSIEAELAQIDAAGRANVAQVQAHRAALRAQRARVERIQRRTIDVLVGSAVLFLVTLALLGVVITHRIVGPVHKIKRLLWDVGNGRLHFTEKLRRGDELTDLFDAFTSMVASLRSAQSREIAELDGIIEAAERADTPRAVLDRLKGLRSKMRAALD